MAFKLTAILAAAVLAGCADYQQRPVAGIVGPSRTDQSGPPASKGSLIVFSECEVVAKPGLPDASDSPDRSGRGYTWEYTNYKVLSPSGRVIKFVNNNEGETVAGPRKVELPAGEYLVEAEAKKYGGVTVPVAIAGGQDTILNLDNSGYWGPDMRPSVSNAVCFPDDTKIGWRADGRVSSAP